MTRPDIFDIESDELDRMLMDFKPKPPEPEHGRRVADQPLDELIAEADELLAEIERKLGGGNDGDAP